MRRIQFVYAIWFTVCLAAVFGLRGAADPSRFHDRIPDKEAEDAALEALHAVNADKYSDYEPINSAWSEAGEMGVEARWIVLCDRRDRSGLAAAVVVEIDGRSGEVLRFRSGIGP